MGMLLFTMIMAHSYLYMIIAQLTNPSQKVGLRACVLSVKYIYIYMDKKGYKIFEWFLKQHYMVILILSLAMLVRKVIRNY